MLKAPQFVAWRRTVALAGLCLLMSGATPAAAQQPDPTGFAMTYSSFSAFTGRCSVDRGIVGREPADGQRHPLFVYLVATAGLYDGPEAMKFVDAMAARGFVAASIEYDMFVGVIPDHLDGKSR